MATHSHKRCQIHKQKKGIEEERERVVDMGHGLGGRPGLADSLGVGLSSMCGQATKWCLLCLYFGIGGECHKTPSEGSVAMAVTATEAFLSPCPKRHTGRGQISYKARTPSL